jgi:3-phosphoshikimate 1-carboxyvinyltransferase
MKDIIIETKKCIKGELTLPGDKSISHRSIMLGAISRGKTAIKNCLRCDDCEYTIGAFKMMGIKITRDKYFTYVFGKGISGLKRPKGKIFLGNSGTSMRILSGILAGQNFKSTLCADKAFSNRPMDRIVKPLRLMGANIKGEGRLNFAPITIEGSILRPVSYALPVPSAQVKSAVLFAGLYAEGKTTVKERFKSRDHTERMLSCFRAKVRSSGVSCCVRGVADLYSCEISVPGDISSASFFIVAATILKGSELAIKNVGLNPTRCGFISVLKRMGACIVAKNIKLVNQEPRGDLIVKSSALKATVIKKQEIPSCIDELPVLMVAASLSEGTTIIKSASELRLKETDRINSMLNNLKALGARIFIDKDDIYIKGVPSLKGTTVMGFGDHRTAMSMAVAGLIAKGKTRIRGIECITKSFPGFFEALGEIVK